jgi:GNAT superfamily N-acetyltransferase
VDIAIECAIEGRDVSVLVDDLQEPSVVLVEASGLLCYFAGDAQHPEAHNAVRQLVGPRIVMPSPEPWIELLYDVHGEMVLVTDRYQFSSESLSYDRLASVVERSPIRHLLRKIEPAMLSSSRGLLGGGRIATDLDTADLGFCAIEGENLLGVAYPSLAHKAAIEVSIFVAPEHRRRGIATLLGAKLAKRALERGLDPHWDAANPVSCRLALKLGYKFIGSYEAHSLAATRPVTA